MTHNFANLAKIVFFLICILFAENLGANTKIEKDFILVLSSYNPDTYRLSGFLSDLEKHLHEKGREEKIIIKDLQYGALNNAGSWKNRMKEVLQAYNQKTLKSILILGQEAWSAFLNQDTLYRDVPFHACFVNNNVLKLPDSTLSSEWTPTLFNGKKKGTQMGYRGGYFNCYDIDTNIRLIQRLYPSVTNIAFLSDNSYGGVALQALIKEKFKHYPQLKLTLLDGRKDKIDNIRKQISTLPANSAILIGTWRIDHNDTYFSRHTIQEIIPSNNTTPVFTLTGLGLESVAIGGYIPTYEVDAKVIADDIANYYSEKKDSTSVFWSPNYYHFDKANLKKFGIREYQLPPNSLVEDKLEGKLKKSHDLILFGSIGLTLLALLTIRLLIIEHKLRNKQKELLAAVARSEQSEKLKSAFLANMSHEIRTPLNAIIGFSELLIQSDDPADKDQFGELIQHNNQILLTLIDDLLDLSKIEAGYIDFTPQNINLHTFTKELHSLFELRVKPSVQLICDLPSPSSWVKIDPKKTMQIMNNYLSNAIKFTPEGSIRFGCELQDNRIYFYVKDTGIGISAQHQSQLFHRFQKVDNLAPGTGLGLYINKTIAEAAGGEVGFQSNEGQGSHFWCSIPYEQPDSVCG